jgi:hypothetical protein
MRKNLLGRAVAARVALSAGVAAVLVVSSSYASGAAFTPGSIVAYRVGSLTTVPSANASPVFLDEYSQNGTLLQTIALPTATGTAPLTYPLTASSTGSEGLLNRSVDGTCLTVPGYAAALGYTSVAGASTTSNERAVAFVNASGGVDTTTRLGTTAFSGSNFRGAATDTCTHVWTTGNGSGKTNYGVWFVTQGGGTVTQLNQTNSQGITISNGQLYVAFAGGATLSTVGTGLPTSGLPTVTAVSGIADFNYRGIAFLTLQSGSTAPDTLYLVNNNVNANYGSIDKYSLSGGTWSKLGSLLMNSLPTSQTMQGLAAINLGDGNVALYFTNGKAGIIYLAIDDSGPTGTGPTSFTTFATTSVSSAVYYGLAPSPVTALPSTAPNATTNATTSGITSTGFTASWTAPASGTEVDAYVVEISTNGFSTIAQTLVLPSSATSVNVTGLTGVTTNATWFRVRAINNTGASPDLSYGINLPQTITFGAAPTGVTVGGTGQVSATASSGLPVVFGSLTPSVCTVSGGTVTGVGSGTCTVTADQSGNTQFAAATEITQSFNVGGIIQTISFGAAPTVVVGGTGTLSATASSGLAVTYASSTPTVCTVSGSTVTGVTAGTCTVSANQAGNGSYQGATQTTQTFSVGQGNQTIAFGTAPSIAVSSNGALSATASSGLAVTFSSATPSVCTVAGNTVTGVSTGTCTIDANQAGNSNYFAAPQMTQSFMVNIASQTIAFTYLPNVVVGTGDSLSATASSGLAVTFSSATPSVCSVSGNTVTAIATGTCVVAADQPGNGNYSAATTADLSFQVSTALTAFTPGSLVVNTIANVNNGGGSLDTAAPMVLQQFQLDPTGATATQTGVLTLPQTPNGNQWQISGEYGSASEGMLQKSVNGLYLTVMGYGVSAGTFNSAVTTVYGTAALGQSTSLTAANQTGTVVTTVPRVVALIATNTSVDTSTALTGLYNQNNPRSVATIDGTAFWTSGQGASNTDPTQGVAYAPLGATTATAIDNSTDTRTVAIVNTGGGNALSLYVSRDRKSSGGIGPFANVDNLAAADGSVPTSASGLVTAQEVPPATPLSLGGNSASINLTAATANGVNNARIGNFVYLSPEQYFLASPTVMYVTDSGQPKSGSANAAALGEGGLQKWILVDGVWTLAYDLVNGLNLVNNANANANTPTAPGVTGLIGLTGRVVNGQVQLFATSYGLNELSQSYLYEITDNLSATSISQVASEQFTVLYTDPTGQTLLRGLAFAPGLQQQITLNAAPAIGVGGAGQLSATGGASGNAVTFTSLTTAVCTVSGTTVTSVSAGICTIAGDQAGNAQYSPATEVSMSFTIGGATQSITVGTVPTSLLAGGTGTLGATASSGLAVTFSSLTTNVCTISGSTVNGVSAGICTIAFDQAGNAQYAAATEVTASFSVATATVAQIITLGSAPGSVAVGATVTLSATASSGLTVTFSSTTPAVCTVSGNVVTAVSAGTCTVAADQAGNSSYSAAPELVESFPVTGGSGGSSSSGDTNGDVPLLPAWGLLLLASGLAAGGARGSLRRKGRSGE